MTDRQPLTELQIAILRFLWERGEATVAEIDGLSVNFTDQHGTWFGGDHGISLYSEGKFKAVSATGARPAGRCA